MPDEPHTEPGSEIYHLFEKAGDSDKCLIMLMLYSTVRKDYVLCKGLRIAANAKGPAQEDDYIGEPDHDLLARIKANCPKNEALWWGRALCQAYLDADRATKDALLALMQRRVAS